MPDGRDHGNPRGVDRTHNRFLVERPEILGRAAAASDDEHIHRIFLIKESDCRRDLSRCLRSLHENGAEDQLHRRPAALRNLVDIAQNGSGG